MSAKPLVMWQLADGRAGHERQVQGLGDALARQVPLERHQIACTARGPGAAINAWRGHFPAGADLPAPDLVVAAGHGCHWPLLAASRATGAPAICLMRPSLPWRWFDLLVVPEHDYPPFGDNVIRTTGVLNPMTAAENKEANLGLILIGGPSRHHGFDADQVLHAVQSIVARSPDLQFIATDSPRTPASFRKRLLALEIERVSYHAYAQGNPTWLSDTLGRAARAWVTADSMNMIFEALSAAAEVSIIDAPVLKADRVTAVVPDLIHRGLVSRVGEPGVGAHPLAEADRVAAEILARFTTGAATP